MGMGSPKAWVVERLGEDYGQVRRGEIEGISGIPARREDEMRRHAIGAVALAVVAMSVLGGASAVAVQPSAGVYNTVQYVVSATPSPSTATCPNKAGQTLGGYLKYPGPGAPGATAATTAVNGRHMWQEICTFPTTPAAGVTSWSAPETCTFTPLPNSPSEPNLDISFDFTFTFIDGNDFLAKGTESIPVPGGTCDETLNIGFTRTGK